MSGEQSQNVAREWLRGVAEFFATTLPDGVTIEPDAAEELTPDGLAGLLEKCPVAFTAVTSTGASVALLVPENLAAHVATLAGAEGGEGDTIDDARLAALKEFAGPMMAAGAAAVSEASGQSIETDDAGAAVLSTGDADQLAEGFGAMDAAAFAWTFESGMSAEGMFVFSTGLIDAQGASAGGSMAEEPLVSDDEMKDILRGFGSDAAEMTSDSGAPRENYDVILDIELTATARLGSIEMPISEILNLGPGSIIEVGQFVDEPIELLVNDKLVARGDVVVVDEKFGLRITEIVSQKERIESLR
jgi:flagellar motor switch protein FliN/FliY